MSKSLENTYKPELSESAANVKSVTDFQSAARINQETDPKQPVNTKPDADPTPTYDLPLSADIRPKLKASRESLRFMKLAIKEAEKAMAAGDVPIGCVLVRDGKVYSKGYNRRTAKGNVLQHAEIIAIDKACRKFGDWRLEECEMYVTLEPCPMCAGAIVQARIPRVYVGCMNPKAGCAGSVLDLFHVEKLNHKVDLVSGVLEEECSALMKNFFKDLRNGKVKISKENAQTNCKSNIS